MRGIERGLGRRQKGRSVAWGPVPVPLAPPASCHQEVGNAADEEGRGGKRSDEDGGHDPGAHGQVCNGQLCKIF